MRIESITSKTNKVLKQIQHKRFRTMNDISSSRSCRWYAVKQASIEPIGDQYHDIHKWPDCIYT